MKSLIGARLENVVATLAVDGNDVVVRLSALEKIGALRGNIRVPLASRPRGAHQRRPLVQLRGIRAPGIGLPGSSRCAAAAMLVSTTSPPSTAGAPRFEMTGASFDRLVVS
jgi:uncharacterized protein